MGGQTLTFEAARGEPERISVYAEPGDHWTMGFRYPGSRKNYLAISDGSILTAWREHDGDRAWYFMLMRHGRAETIVLEPRRIVLQLPEGESFDWMLRGWDLADFGPPA